MSSNSMNLAGIDTNKSIHDLPTDIHDPLVRRGPSVNEDQQLQNIIPRSCQSSDTVRQLQKQPSYCSINDQSQSIGHLRQGPIDSAKPCNQFDGVHLESSNLGILPALTHSLNSGRQKAKKSGSAHRIPSTLRAPHRGQEFSVDDDVSEVESQLNKSSRKQPLNLKQEPTGHPLTKLITLASEDEETSANDKFDMSTVSGVFTGMTEAEAEGLAKVRRASNSAAEGVANEDEIEIEDDEIISDAESFTLKDRQQAINKTHPFGIRIWKPALYKKTPSVQKDAEGDIHSSPGWLVRLWLFIFNILWTILFGWWLGLVALAGAVLCFIFEATSGAKRYGQVLMGLSGYLFYPFGKFIRLEQDKAYAQEDEGEGRSITEYEQWQNCDLEDGRLYFGPQGSQSIVGRSRQSITSVVSVVNENDSLLGRNTRKPYCKDSNLPQKKRFFGRGQWNTGRVIFFLFFYGIIYPLMMLVSGICWFLVFWIPMGKVTLLLLYHLRRHPLAISFQLDSAYSRGKFPKSSILVCNYRAVGLKYWKYTIDGTNIFLINLMGVVLFVVFDYFILVKALGLKGLIITHPAFLFIASLLSMIPLAYFIGQAVASISAQSSMGIAAAVNALFSTIVEVFLYCLALNQGKRELVEGCIVGNLLAGILFLPGLSMCFGAIKRKTQRFNAKSASATSTMLLFAVIPVFGPTLFYEIFGTHQMNCLGCIETDGSITSHDCRECHFSQKPSLNNRFYVDAVRPFSWIAAILLFMAYMIGLWFTLRTHAAVIWNDVDEKKVPEAPLASIQSLVHDCCHGQSLLHGNGTRRKSHDFQTHKNIPNQYLRQLGHKTCREIFQKKSKNEPRLPQFSSQTTDQPPRKGGAVVNSKFEMSFSGLSEVQNTSLVSEPVDVADTLASVAENDDTNSNKMRKAFDSPHHRSLYSTFHDQNDIHDVKQARSPEEAPVVGHDSPNWGRIKSAIVLFVATVLYALIAEILVGTTDVVLKNISVSEKFLGITLVALVPNTSEFLNAISFAMDGNIALSIEIGSAYVLQVCLLQIPALVFYSSINGHYLRSPDAMDHKFSLIFPNWDMIIITLCVFLLSNVYGEGKSNYFKGGILLLSYLFVITGFWLSDMIDLGAMTDLKFDVS